MSPDQRRAIFEKAQRNALARGAPMDNNPLFIEAVEEWIAGHIEMDDLKTQYALLVSKKRMNQ